MSTREIFEAAAATSKKKGFDKWLDEPMTRALVSMIPETENKDIVRAVLQAAYNCGFDTGAGVTAVNFFETMLREPKR